MRKWALLLLSSILVVVLPGIVKGGWNRVQLADGTQVCQDADTQAQFKPPYAAKADVTKACNTLTSFLPWLGTAEAASLRFTLNQNPDGTRDTTYPCVLADLSDCKPPAQASLAWSTSCLNAALAVIATQSTAVTTSIAIDTASGCLSGTNAASATLSFVQAADNATSCAAQWSITGSSPNRTLSDASPSAGSGSCKLKATYMSNSVLSNAYPWAYQAPPSTDSLAPPIPTDIVATGGTNQVVITGDTPWDACGNAVCKGTQDIQIQADGSGTLATVTVNPGFSCSPTLTNLGSMTTSPTASQTGNDWSIAGAGTMDGTSDAYAFNNCAFTGAGFATAIFGTFGSTTSNYQKEVLARRESQTAVGSRAIIAGVEHASTGDGGGDFIFVDARLTTDASRVHLIDVIAVTLPVCGKLSWDSSNAHTFSTATVTGGKCNNDWTTRLASYSFSMPSTTYVGLGMSSGAGSSGANTTASITQFDLNNVARWSYTHPTASSHTYAARARDKEGTPNASAYSPTTTGAPSSGGTNAVRWHPGPYYDCSENGNPFIAIGNAAYTALNACIDAAATYTNVKGIFFLCLWTCWEGDTAGSYDGTVANSNGGVNTIGYPLFDAILTRAGNLGLKVIIGINWFQQGQPGCSYVFPKYLIQSGSCSSTGGGNAGSGGTDAAGAYGITVASDNYSIWIRLWKAAAMDRLIALMQAYGSRYDSNSALEGIILIEQDPAFFAGSLDGFTWPAFETQTVRMINALRSSWLHTNLFVSNNWYTPSGEISILAAAANASNYIGISANNTIVWQTSYGECTYIGCGVFQGNNFGTTDYRAQIPLIVWTAGPELCDLWDSYAHRNGLPASSNTTPQQFYDTYFTNGKSDSPTTPARPLNPAYWITGGVNGTASYTCGSVASQQWGTPTSGGFRQFWSTHNTNTTAPTRYPAVNTN